MRTFCAAGLEPVEQWRRGRCSAMDDASLLDRFYHPVPPAGRQAARESRQAAAALRKTEPHHNGYVFVPARRGSAPRA